MVAERLAALPRDGRLPGPAPQVIAAIQLLVGFGDNATFLCGPAATGAGVRARDAQGESPGSMSVGGCLINMIEHWQRAETW